MGNRNVTARVGKPSQPADIYNGCLKRVITLPLPVAGSLKRGILLISQLVHSGWL